MKKALSVLLILQLFLLTPAVAAEQEDEFVKNTQDDILMVAGAGLAGAILGLSTLSFYETPSLHVGNIWTGAAVGIIAGVVFVAYNSAQKGSEELVTMKSSSEFDTFDRGQWHGKNIQLTSSQAPVLSAPFWQTNF